MQKNEELRRIKLILEKKNKEKGIILLRFKMIYYGNLNSGVILVQGLKNRFM